MKNISKDNMKILLGALIILVILIFILLPKLDQGEHEVFAKDITDIEQEYPKDAKEVNYTLNLTNDKERIYINDQLVGEEMRVPQNTILKVQVINNMDYETSIHFHGIRGLSKMDGVGGITQDNIKPGGNYNYEFYLDDPGTYMYHSHVDSENQINNEYLFGALIVEGQEQQSFTNKQSIIFNEPVVGNRQITANGRSEVGYEMQNDGDIYLNLINLSSTPTTIYFGDDIEYKIVNVDANAVQSKSQKNSEIYLPVANRMEVVIKNPHKNFQVLSTQNGKSNAKINIYTEDNTDIKVSQNIKYTKENQEYFDHKDVNYLYDIISMNDSLELKDKVPDKVFDMQLSMSNMNWTINDKAYPNTDKVIVDEGDIVEITLDGGSGMHNFSHPFHLHGHEFELISVDEEELEENIVLDTLEVLPGHEYKIRFNANNPGIWAFHCHNLDHAARGMMTTLEYNGYYFKSEDKAEE